MLENTVVLTVAGSDSGGGAGIQADIKTFSACGVYAASVITAITAQNLEGVRAIQGIKPEIITAQIRAVLEGFPIKALKTGMLFSAAIIEAVAVVLADYPRLPLVLDPVFAATSGARLIRPSAIRVLAEKLFPLALLITPNLPEAEYLLKRKISNQDAMPAAAQALFAEFGVPVLLKGGHLSTQADDILCDAQGQEIFAAEFVKNVNSHGSGCTYAAAIAAFLARGEKLRPAVALAKAYVSGTLQNAHYLSPGVRVINHFFRDC
jgi:hydroxymethylpyrimidine kinase/phosphomethylpyrimidine kinase